MRGVLTGEVFNAVVFHGFLLEQGVIRATEHATRILSAGANKGSCEAVLPLLSTSAHSS